MSTGRIGICFLLISVAFSDHQYQRDVQVEDVIGQPDALLLTASDPRPLDQLVLYMNRKLGWLVDYEDPPFSYKSELIGSVTKEWLASGGKEYFIPNGGTFTYKTTRAVLGVGNPNLEVLRSIALTYNKTPNPGIFEAIPELKDRLSLTGTAIKDDRGFTHGVRPVLSSTVSLEAKRQSIMEAFRVC